MNDTARPTTDTLIVIRTRNRPLLLQRALDDVLAQTSRRWAAVIINDGGDPASVDAAVAERSKALAGRVTVLHERREIGMEAASNRAIRARDSNYIAIHDDDDTWAPTFLERTTAWLREHPATEAVSAHTDIVWERIESDGGITELEREPLWPDVADVTLIHLLRINRIVPISLVYRRRLHESVGDYDETLPVIGDWEFYLRIAERRPIDRIPGAPLAFWHQRREAEGPNANSVIRLHGAHDRYDHLVRDRALRDYAATHGLGEALFLTRFLDQRFDEVRDRQARIESKLDRVLAALGEHPEPAAGRDDSGPATGAPVPGAPSYLADQPRLKE